MGIKRFNEFFGEVTPSAYGKIRMQDLRGRRIAIDACNIMWRWYSASASQVIDATDIVRQDPNQEDIVKNWISLSFHSLKTWLRNGITPIMVFDGKHPEEKKKEQQKRAEDRQKSKDRSEAIRTKLRNSDLVNRNDPEIQEMKQLLKRTMCPSGEERTLYRQTLEMMGIPCLSAIGDGERLCSFLAIDGIVEAVYSTDTDCLVYGCPLLITGLEDEDGTIMCNVVVLNNMLKELKWPFRKFVDLAIMMGCDYNTNIRGIGPKKAYGLLQEYDSIDEIPAKYDKSVLCHERCRELFAFEDISKVMIVDETVDNLYNYNREAIRCNGRDALQPFNCLNHYYDIWTITETLPTPTSRRHSRSPPQVVLSDD